MISIIIPIYNTKTYLIRCIKSVLKSTYRDFELILINDGSTDKSSEVCRRCCKEDNRIIFIDQEHKGVSAARNRGIEESHGEWIVFIDSDDIISQDYLEYIAKEKNQFYDLQIYDLSVASKRGECQKWAAEYYFKKEDRLGLIEKLLKMEQLVEKGSTRLPSPCAKAYRRSVINKYRIRFRQNIAIGEDRLFNIEYFLNLKSCIYIPKIVYFVTTRKESAMHRFHPDFLENDFRYQEQLKYILEEERIFQRIAKAYYNSVLSNMADVLVRGIFNPYSTRSYTENCRLCQKMQKYKIYRKALRYNLQTGVVPRRILLWTFSKEYYKITELISKGSYKILDWMRQL